MAIFNCIKSIMLIVLLSFYCRAFCQPTLITSDQLKFINESAKIDSAKAWLNLGVKYRVQKEYDNALICYNNSLLYKPDYAQAFINRGVIYWLTENDSLALQDYTTAIQLDPSNPGGYANRGVLYAQFGKPYVALTDFDKALKIDSIHWDALNNKSLIFYQLEEFDRCIKTLDIFLAVYSDADHYNLRALAKVGLFDYKGAQEDYNKAIELDPNNPILYQNRSFMFYKKGDKKKALKDALQAEKLGLKMDANYLNVLK